MNRRAHLRLIAPSASPQEAAAVVAALERFMRETAPSPAPGPTPPDPWLRAARHEAVSPSPAALPWWGDAHGWG